MKKNLFRLFQQLKIDDKVKFFNKNQPSLIFIYENRYLFLSFLSTKNTINHIDIGKK